jgi:hypothetical protein
MKELLKSVEALTAEELARSYEKFSKFNSPHEGWAVMLEESNEHTEDCGKINGAMQAFWEQVKLNNREAQGKIALQVKQYSIHAAAEAIQVAAMAQKYIDSLGYYTP